MLERQLAQGIEQMGLSVTVAQQALLMDYLRLMEKWNKAINLTAVRDPAEMVTKHLLDSLSILPYVQAERCIDVGSGGGLPGIPLAIVRPDLAVTLLDSNGKKSRFQFQAATALKLNNITVVNKRVEQFLPEQLFDQIISRAFSSIEDMVHWTEHLGTKDAQWLAMKGVYPEAELTALPASLTCSAVHHLAVPGSDGERHLVVLERAVAH
ncbi:16S rRNA (guanine527-N7)-methyltransferase [Oceanospirillum multiglobuliferum]|uniref:Ribosomal RNA small subunit methyltransferase G n=1 Tax=Oceanospirillum multiglobuliferum TaxID=64969 RepID=A0A1T4NRZ2_9GAMM|nr:16S rRNA (guanine(527)-N(7))-methyltransferase RsmG [Oceanospirillum multiglobuliferum]OPX55685.1 16S rRNA (guanine(527)-N(7))-methyltransferase RsmG [Oceanospirillum multiglobuliferum]SJZ82071.1 16S rRNA (guanine527-N7)-methyltransferase [Oceanospirillum multiglobuliferum]